MRTRIVRGLCSLALCDTGLAAPAAAHAAADHKDARLGFKIQTPRDWTEIPQQVDERWVVAKFLSDKLNRWTDPSGWTWEHKPDLYLAVAKVEPLVRALGELDGWITGVRRDQSPTRANAPKLGWDAQHELWKANPLADWSDDDCWTYIRERGLPYNALHDRGYSSIGDTHSTLPGEGREGRWAGSDRTECGLHQT